MPSMVDADIVLGRARRGGVATEQERR